MAKDWTEENLDAQIQTELTSGEYWEIQADMWRNKYLDAAEEIERLRGMHQVEMRWANDCNAEVKRLRGGLEHIVEIYEYHVKTYDHVPSNLYLMAKIARETLKEKENADSFSE